MVMCKVAGSPPSNAPEHYTAATARKEVNDTSSSSRDIPPVVAHCRLLRKIMLR